MDHVYSETFRAGKYLFRCVVHTSYAKCSSVVSNCCKHTSDYEFMLQFLDLTKDALFWTQRLQHAPSSSFALLSNVLLRFELRAPRSHCVVENRGQISHFHRVKNLGRAERTSESKYLAKSRSKPLICTFCVGSLRGLGDSTYFPDQVFRGYVLCFQHVAPLQKQRASKTIGGQFRTFTPV